MAIMWSATPKPGAKDVRLLENVFVSPSEYVYKAVQHTSISLTVGVFIGAALTSGIVCGAVTFFLASETVFKRLRQNILRLAATARESALRSREGQALSNAVLSSAAAALAGGREGGTLRALVCTGRKAVCVGKNYREHITELAQLGPEWKLEEEPEPVLFLKPTTSYAWPGQPVVLPRSRKGAAPSRQHGIHHELELGVIIGKRVKDVGDEASAMDAVAGYVLGLDITERDEQTAAKNKGMPWTISKGYDTFLPLSEPFSLSGGEDWRALRLWLKVNGQERQACDAGAMIHGVGDLICFISSVMTLEAGDLILTGTPAGVGVLCPGDRITAGVEGHCQMTVDVVEQSILGNRR